MVPASNQATAETWLELHSQECLRFHVFLTRESCAAAASQDPERCRGCGGLENQSMPLLRPEVVTASAPIPSKQAALKDLVLADISAGHPLGDEIGADRPHPDQELLSLLFSLFDEEEARERPQRITRRKGGVAVYVGRCIRCDGYMSNAIEKQFSEHDEEVYRCHNCGWRTSPVYAFNRNNQNQRR